MRLSEVLSKPPNISFVQVDGFLTGKQCKAGQRIALDIGTIALNFYCADIDTTRTFYSVGKTICTCTSRSLISIDCVLNCNEQPDLQAWFAIESNGYITDVAPWVRVKSKVINSPPQVKEAQGGYGQYADLLEKADRAHCLGLGAGAIVYLRTILEAVTKQTANAADVPLRTSKNKRRPFKDLLTEVDCKCAIIPKEFSANGYKLFQELSETVHGNSNEQQAIENYAVLRRLVIGVLDNIQNSGELQACITALGWEEKGESLL